MTKCSSGTWTNSAVDGDRDRSPRPRRGGPRRAGTPAVPSVPVMTGVQVQHRADGHRAPEGRVEPRRDGRRGQQPVQGAERVVHRRPRAHPRGRATGRTLVLLGDPEGRPRGCARRRRWTTRSAPCTGCWPRLPSRRGSTPPLGALFFFSVLHLHARRRRHARDGGCTCAARATSTRSRDRSRSPRTAIFGPGAARALRHPRAGGGRRASPRGAQVGRYLEHLEVSPVSNPPHAVDVLLLRIEPFRYAPRPEPIPVAGPAPTS